MNNAKASRNLFTHPLLRRICLAILFALAVGVRLMDLTDLPLDTNPTRQLHSALKARGMYMQDASGVPDWQRQVAVKQWERGGIIEPEILENLVAWTYRLTGPHLWVARLYSILFWTLGGAALYALARRLTDFDGAILALAFYLFLPYGIIDSRSFQPDPLMVALLVGFLWAFERWGSLRNWRWALAAGLLGGLSILVKSTAVFFVAGAWLGGILGLGQLKKTLRDGRFWLLNGLLALPAAAYTIYGLFVVDYLGQQFSGRFIPSLFLSLNYYINWEAQLDLVIGHVPLALGLVGLFFLLRGPLRGLAPGLWGGYLVFGLVFNYHISTHTYYQLPFIPVVALSLAPLAGILTGSLLDLWKGSRWVHGALLVALAFSLLAVSWDARRTLRRVDYRPQAEFWSAITAMVGNDALVVGITEDYGVRAAYWGWLDIGIWPSISDQAYHVLAGGSGSAFSDLFAEQVSGREYFLVTDFEEYEKQDELAAYLAANFPVFASGEGYIIYDLRGHP
ncbi:MAG: glycosyltransferase family 39 protein [Chloroflexi bacterium]|nr:glycosyltransferase family 39 protein [Chloroflexota bacterium]